MHPVSSEEHRQQLLAMQPESFVLALTHDMRGRISMIMGSVEMLRDGVDDPEAALSSDDSRKLLDIIEKSGGELLKLAMILQDYPAFNPNPENHSPHADGKP